MRIDVTADGPYFVSGGVPMSKTAISTNERGESVAWVEGEALPAEDCYALCRCGRSGSKPFCDGGHATVGFDGTETASREPYVDQAACTTGPALKLRDARHLCAEARFCDRAGGLWNLVTAADDPDSVALVEEEAALCPSGRYVACDHDTEEPHEPALEPSIGLVQDPGLGVSGPLWVRGGIPVFAADGDGYEVRNRVTLCPGFRS
ncbi:MAG: CDGSH iron-sulfur domain-containing protein [Coriobacteriia bacterium]